MTVTERMIRAGRKLLTGTTTDNANDWLRELYEAMEAARTTPERAEGYYWVVTSKDARPIIMHWSDNQWTDTLGIISLSGITVISGPLAPPLDDTGWIAHDGSARPAAAHPLTCKVRLRDGTITPVNSAVPFYWKWSHMGNAQRHNDIIAWRNTEAVLTEPDPWTAWDGTGTPPRDVTHVRFRSGNECPTNGRILSWRHTNLSAGDIVAYRR